MSTTGTVAPAVFVSYASADKATAAALTSYLESHGIRCWMAPRDVPSGALYADAIVRAINDAPTLLLSRNSIGSAHVGKELERGLLEAQANHRGASGRCAPHACIRVLP